MLAGGEVAFEDMTQPQLKAELAARGEARSGLKYVLQRPLGCSMRRSAARAGSQEPSRRGGRTQRWVR